MPAVVLPVAVDRPVQTVGRRKEAIVRIRLVPGNGTFTLNGRTLDSYFPNKVHQQLIKEPLVILEKARDLRRHRPAARRRRHRPGRRAAAGHRPRADRARRDRSSAAEEGRVPDPRRARHRAQEVRTEEGPQGAPVLEALIGVGGRLFGTDGVRGLANADLTPALALRLATAAAQVLGERRVRRPRRRVRAVLGRRRGRSVAVAGPVPSAAPAARWSAGIRGPAARCWRPRSPPGWPRPGSTCCCSACCRRRPSRSSPTTSAPTSAW